jgi:hypothetical protein
MYAENGECGEGERKYRLSISTGKVWLCPSALDFPLPSQLPPLPPPPHSHHYARQTLDVFSVCVDLWLVSQCACSDEQVQKCRRRRERAIRALTGFVAWGRSIESRKIHRSWQKVQFCLIPKHKIVYGRWCWAAGGKCSAVAWNGSRY